MVKKKKGKGYITTNAGKERAGVTLSTIIIWCEKYGIGIKVGGRWRIDPDKLDELLKEGNRPDGTKETNSA